MNLERPWTRMVADRISIGEANREAVRALLSSHLGITRVEIAEILKLSTMAVTRHVTAIRAEWGAKSIPTKRGKSHDRT